ncbi:hypothetical protein M3906_000233 [Vibrio metschnikovii]|nr:hypothetical protein [Vibrio metschnikovii]
MKVKPMIFNTEMVKALMTGDKVVTRRPASPQPEPSGRGYDWWPSNKLEAMVQVSGFEEIDCDFSRDMTKEMVRDACPTANVGDLIYVRETFRLFNNSDECGCSDHCSCPPTGTPIYLATSGDDSESKWTPSIHMPRSVSRLTLKVTDVRIERIKDITHDQVRAEGFKDWTGLAFTWSSIYLKQGLGWDDNPYVWAIEFEVIHQNVDKYLESIGDAE